MPTKKPVKRKSTAKARPRASFPSNASNLLLQAFSEMVVSHEAPSFKDVNSCVAILRNAKDIDTLRRVIESMQDEIRNRRG